MFRNYLKTVSVLACMALLGACGGGGEDSGNPASFTARSADGMVGGFNVDTQFNGTWQTNCEILDPNDPATEYSISAFKINGDRGEAIADVYTDSNCQTRAPIFYRMVLEFELNYTGEFTETGLGRAHNVNFTIDRGTFNNNYNLSHAELVEMEMDKPFHDLMFATGNTFYMGDYTDLNDGSSPSKRPVALDQETIYYKVR